MDDNRRKLLTEEILGECLHNWKWQPGGGLYCTRCSIDLYKPGDIRYEQVIPVPQERTFITGNDMIALKDRIVEMGEWVWFIKYCNTKWWNEEMHKDFNWCEPAFTDWLFTPTRFAELCASWWQERKVRG